MVKIVGGVIVSELDSSNRNNDLDLNSSSSSFLSSNVNLFGYTVPMWTMSLPILGGFFFGGLPGGMIASSVVGVGYCLSDNSQQGTSTSSSSSQRSQRNSRHQQQQRKTNVKSISDYPKPVKC